MEKEYRARDGGTGGFGLRLVDVVGSGHVDCWLIVHWLSFVDKEVSLRVFGHWRGEMRECLWSIIVMELVIGGEKGCS